MLDPHVRRVLEDTSIAHLATVLPDGSPHATPVYVGTHGEHIVLFTGPDMRKARNLRRDPRLALSIAPVDNPFEPVVVRGRVVDWIEGDAAWEIIDRLACSTRCALPARPTTGRGRDRARAADRRDGLIMIGTAPARWS